MDDMLILLEEEPIVIVELQGEGGDAPDPYQIAVENGYTGTREQWYSHLFTPQSDIQVTDLFTLYQLAKL